MKWVCSLAAAALALVGAASPAAAQWRPSLDVGAGVRGNVLVSSRMMLLQGALGYESRHAFFHLDGRLARLDDGGGESQGAFAGLLRTPEWGGVRAELLGRAAAERLPGQEASTRLELAAGPGLRTRLASGYLHGGASHLSRDGEARYAQHLELFLERSLAFARLSVLARGTTFDDLGHATRDTVYVVGGFPFQSTYRALVEQSHAYADVELAVALPLARGAVAEASAGVRAGRLPSGPERWARVRAEVPLAGRVALVAEVGRRPYVPEERLPSRRALWLGVRLKPPAPRAARPSLAGAPEAGETTFAAVAGGDGARILRWSGIAAARVEVMGDFTDWEPLALAHVGGGVWEAQRRLAPGTYRLLLRVDGGEWAPPPGLPRVADEFGGASGVLVIP